MNSIVDFPFKKAYVTGTGTVVSGPCVLHTIVLNGVTTVGGTVTVYDALDATDASTIIAVYDLLGLSVSYQGITFTYDCEIVTGIHMVFATAVANFTVTYR